VASDTLQLSDELYNICGIDPFDFEGTLEAYLGLVHPDYCDGVRAGLHAAVEHNAQYHDEYPLVRPSGDTVWVEARGDPVLDSAGQPLGVRGVCQDLTERRRVEDRLRDAVEQLREADRLKDEFLALVSHELRTPLAAIVGFSLALRELNRDNPDQLDIAVRMSGNAEEMRRMVDRLLDFSRLEAGRVEVDPVEVVLAEAVERICFTLTGLLAGHELVIDIDPSVRAMADIEGLTRVIGNLVTNAVKFSPAGTPIAISAEPQDDDVVVSVRDEGVGIPADLQPRVFERFFQAPDQPVGKRGTGVGLSIAHRYVELHGGRIWVESAPGAGSTFRFTLRAGPTTKG
jgi:PAS domain S-box-containing protein